MSLRAVTANDIWTKYGYEQPKPWRKKVLQNPREDCFAYCPGSPSSGERCDVLLRLYCRYDNCNFYKNKDEYERGEKHGQRNCEPS